MAFIRSDGAIQLSDGRVIYADSLIYGQDLCEIIPLCVPAPAWPFVSGGYGSGGNGVIGEDGAQGNQGPAGAFGGPQGAQGSQGRQGNQGNQGAVGSGAQGSQGAQGNQGNQGRQGNQGNQGAVGSGAQGSQGSQGVQGPQGRQGNQGFQGAGENQAAFDARLDTTNGVSDVLTLLPYEGDQIEVNGESVTIPGVGFDRDVSDNLITAVGADSGAPGAATTLYYVYISNSLASFSPSSIRLSATAPSLVSGVKYLGVAGNALNWRFVGYAKLNATPQFESSVRARLIVNYYNRWLANLFVAPNYTNTNGFVSVDIPGTWGPINSGVGDSFQFISNGEDGVNLEAEAMISSAGIQCEIGISVDSGDPTEAAFTNIGGATTSIGSSTKIMPSEGDHTSTLYGWTATLGATSWFSDIPRNGLTTTPHVTYMSGYLLI